MKKLISLLSLAAVSLAGHAEVYTFLTEGASNQRRAYFETTPYYSEPTQSVYIPFGYYCTKPKFLAKDNTIIPPTPTSKALVSDGVMLQEISGSNAGNVNIYGAYRMYFKSPIKVTPAAGLTVKSIKVRISRTNYNDVIAIVTPNADGSDVTVVQDFTVKKSDSIQTWEGSLSEPFHIAVAYQSNATRDHTRVLSFDIETEGTSTQTAIPVCDKSIPMIASDEKVSLSCPTAGAKIYYTISYDGSYKEPSAASTLYTAPFTLQGNAIVRAVAIKDGMSASFPIYKEFYVTPEKVAVDASFDFTDVNKLFDADGNPYPADAFKNGGYPAASGGTDYLDLTDKKYTLYQNGYSVDGKSLDTGTKCQVLISEAYGQFTELRTNLTSKAPEGAVSGLDIMAPEGKYIRALLIEGSAVADYTANQGKLTMSPYNQSHLIWTAQDGENTNKVEIRTESGNICRLHILTDASSVGAVNDIILDDESTSSPAEYFSLQGIRVLNPASGLYIKRQGRKVTKIYVK